MFHNSWPSEFSFKTSNKLGGRVSLTNRIDPWGFSAFRKIAAQVHINWSTNNTSEAQTIWKKCHPRKYPNSQRNWLIAVTLDENLQAPNIISVETYRSSQQIYRSSIFCLRNIMTWARNYEIWLEAHHIAWYFHFRDIDFGYLGCILNDLQSSWLYNCREVWRIHQPIPTKNQPGLIIWGSVGQLQGIWICYGKLDKQISTLLFSYLFGFLLRQKELDSLNIIEHRIHLETRTRQQESYRIQQKNSS